MLFRLEITTTEQLTIERDSREEAEAKARQIEEEAQQHAHHGEKTTVKVVQVLHSR